MPITIYLGSQIFWALQWDQNQFLCPVLTLKKEDDLVTYIVTFREKQKTYLLFLKYVPHNLSISEIQYRISTI